MSEATLLPVGTILPYASDVPPPDGWLSCDGAGYDWTVRAELFLVTGTAFGSPGPRQFAVPDLRGLFVRCCDDGSGRDSRVGKRSALAPGGSTGDRAGSYQDYGTAPAHRPFRTTFSNCDLSKSGVTPGPALPAGNWNDYTTQVQATRGGDPESRPPNIYADWIIKASSRVADSSGYTMVPVGAVIAYAGNDPGKVDAAAWLLCDGRTIATTGDNNALAAALDQAYGRPDAQHVCLPDFRGRFIRGVDRAQGRDPEAADRAAPYPQAGTQGFAGNTGDAIGSVQQTATGLPSPPLYSIIRNLPLSPTQRGVPGSALSLAGCWEGTTDVNLVAEGGDNETRPRNTAVDWFVAALPADGAVADDHVPVGAVVAVGQQVLDGDSFLPCSGQPLAKADYPELYARIGNLYGGDPSGTSFNLPDYRGVFLRGADHGANVDPDAAARVFSPSAVPPPAAGTAGSYQDYATKAPGKPFVATVPHIPRCKVEAQGNPIYSACRIDGDLTTATCTAGGNGDTAPANVYAQFFIKTRS